MKRNVFILLSILLLVVGCSHTVNLALRPSFQENLSPGNELSSIQPAIKFSQGEFTDKRADIGKLASFKQGVHTFNLYDERPIDEALYEGLQVMMTASGHEWLGEETGQVKIDMQFLGFQASRNAGFIKVGASSNIQIKLDFIDTKTDEVIYSQVYNGTDERDQALIGLMDMVKKSIDASIINCISNVGEDADLARALKKNNN